MARSGDRPTRECFATRGRRRRPKFTRRTLERGTVSMLEHLYFPHDISTFGPTIDLLFEIIFWVTSIVGLAVFAAMLIFIVRYRHTPGRKATYIEGNSRLEIFWTSATTI